jgi:endonuclease/exonuclease/phosphatase family metal-dependent hydrolase
MVYGDQNSLKQCDEYYHQQLLCNQIYVRKDTDWDLVDSGVVKISSDFDLQGGGGRAKGKLAIRSMVWAKFKRDNLPIAYVMCTHITGGRFEDQYFVQNLLEERSQQLERIISFYESRPDPKQHDVGILVGDFNATMDYDPGGAMSSYFKGAIAGSEGVQADAKEAGLRLDSLEDHFKHYMISPFTAIRRRGWFHAYGAEVGITSGFGHLIDHMVTSRSIDCASAKVIYLTNQKFGDRPKDTELPLTDHNSVKVEFKIAWDSETVQDCRLKLEEWFRSKSESRGVRQSLVKQILVKVGQQSGDDFEKLLQHIGYNTEYIVWEDFQDMVFSQKPLSQCVRS